MRLFNIMATAFDNFDRSIQTFLSKTFNNLGLNYSHSQIFGVIFDGMKGIMQNIMFYIEDAFTEQNIYTATRKKSIYSLAKISGYEPYYGSAASGVVLGSLIINNGVTASKLVISNNTKLLNTVNGLTYTIDMGTDNYIVDVTKPLFKHEFKVVQGTYVNATSAAKGYQLETIHIDTAALYDKNYIEVKVNGITFDQVSNIYDMTENSKEYVVTTGYDNAFDIMFGNGTYGYSLQEGDTVTIKYLSHAGSIGNVLSTNASNFVFADMAYDAFGNRVNPNDFILLTTNSSITGGTNADSLDFIKDMVGTNSRSLVLASEDNFRLFFKRFSFIGYVNCWSERNSMTVITTCLRNITNTVTDADNYYALTSNALILNDDEKQMIQETLDNSKRSFAGVTLKFQDPVIRKYSVICYVKPDNVYNKQSIEESIKTTLATYFINLREGTQFIGKSNLITAILANNSNIASIDIDILSELNETAYYNGYYNMYELKMINETYQYVQKRVAYEKDTVAGLDNYGNILLTTKLEIPLLNSFRYYTDKDNYDKTDSVIMPAVQTIFI